ncbi:MAG: hypothetical protein Q8L86_04075 [Vicinamibacterales bacterium]|nr:hypothetical protein [Vicinamibacterales bacterium]
MNTISNGNPIQELARQLVQKFDTNRDGQLTTQEFTGFLTTFLGSLGKDGAASATATAGSGAGVAQGYQVASAETGLLAGRGGGYAYGGFDFNQAAANRDVTKSAKYAFAEATRRAEEQGAGTMWHTKAGAEQFARQYVKPFLEQQGFSVHEIVGDKMRVSTRENPGGEWVDFVENVDGAHPRLAWQSDGAASTHFAPRG